MVDLVGFSPASHSTVIKTPVSMACKSSTARNVGESVIKRAEHRAAACDPGPLGNYRPPPTPMFLVLPDLPDEHLVNVALDSGINFDRTSSSPTALISIISANELAQANLAKVKAVLAASAACAPADPMPATVPSSLPVEDGSSHPLPPTPMWG